MTVGTSSTRRIAEKDFAKGSDFVIPTDGGVLLVNIGVPIGRASGLCGIPLAKVAVIFSLAETRKSKNVDDSVLTGHRGSSSRQNVCARRHSIAVR